MSGIFFRRFVTLNAQLLSDLFRTLADQLDVIAPGPPVISSPVIFKNKESFFMGEITVKDSDAPLGATVTFLDAKGATTTPDDVPAWTSSDETVATVAASDDGLTGTVTIGMPGATVIEVSTVESNTGDTITAQGTVTVQAGDSVIGSVEFTPGT